MAELRQLADNVWAFMSRACDHYAKWAGDGWGQDLHSDCLERGLESPIEDLFWIAAKTIVTVRFIEVNPGPEPDGKGGGRWPTSSFFMDAQAQIGRFRVDFAIRYGAQQPIVVELDGHDFHDKDKKQRAYEKSRDRFLTAQGYRVMHFTGSEVVADPFKVAHEVLLLLGIVDPEYDAEDPLGTGG